MPITEPIRPIQGAVDARLAKLSKPRFISVPTALAERMEAFLQLPALLLAFYD